MLNNKEIKAFLEPVQEERLAAIQQFIDLLENKLPDGFEGRAAGKMLSWDVPLSTYPNGYHCAPGGPLPFISLANQKGFIALYHMGLYAEPVLHEWFVSEYPKHAKYKLNMGKSCIRFKRIDDIPFDLIGELLGKMSVQDWINLYEKEYVK